MRFYIPLSSLAVLALRASATPVDPPSGYSASYSTFNNLNCDTQSWGMQLIPKDVVGLCENLSHPAISVDLNNLAEGCSGRLILILVSASQIRDATCLRNPSAGA